MFSSSLDGAEQIVYGGDVVGEWVLKLKRRSPSVWSSPEIVAFKV